jgi:hypothetical protein
MSGSGDTSDTTAAQSFAQILTSREPIQYVIVHNGKHTPCAWRAALPSLLRWTWQTISGEPIGTGTVQLAVPMKAPARPRHQPQPLREGSLRNHRSPNDALCKNSLTYQGFRLAAPSGLTNKNQG